MKKVKHSIQMRRRRSCGHEEFVTDGQNCKKADEEVETKHFEVELEMKNKRFTVGYL